MKIYIASSWKNQHAVEMLTDLLLGRGYDVLSFIRNANEEPVKATEIKDFESWVSSDRAAKSFEYDTDGATKSGLVIYIGPSGTDAWAEVGAAWGAGVPIIGLWAKGEQAGLMRRMMDCWFDDYSKLLEAIHEFAPPNNFSFTELENIGAPR